MRTLPTLLIPLAALIAGCGSDEAADAAPAGKPESAAATDAPQATPSSNVDNSEGDGTEWRVEYSGDLEGTVSGTILSVTGIGSNTVLAGADINDEITGAADHSFRAQISRYGDTPAVRFTLTLGDGTKCQDAAVVGDEPSSIEIEDAERRTFRARMSGSLVCGPERDRRIDYTAMVDADP
ncbi:hypothetical protein [Halomonas denitrificans]|nr:hypothetical protein [Halomonas denitrificans]